MGIFSAFSRACIGQSNKFLPRIDQVGMPQRIHVAGIGFKQNEIMAVPFCLNKKMKANTSIDVLLELRIEENAHDANGKAVGVWYGNLHLGYIPTEIAPTIIRKMMEYANGGNMATQGVISRRGLFARGNLPEWGVEVIA